MAGKKDDSIEIDLYKDVVLGAVKIVNQTFRVALPGVVSSFARSTSRAALQLAVRFLGTDRIPREESSVVDCPVIVPRGGGYGFHFDLREGDPTVVLCADSPVRGYYETGDTVTPQFPTGHQYGTSVCFAGGRVSNSTQGQETDPPNAEGTGLIGAEDGSATITFSGAQLPNPQELGTVVIATAGPMASLKLGSDQANLGVARQTDPVGPTVDMAAYLAAVGAAINTLAPGTVSPTILAAVAIQIGTITTGSIKVVSD